MSKLRNIGLMHMSQDRRFRCHVCSVILDEVWSGDEYGPLCDKHRDARLKDLSSTGRIGNHTRGVSGNGRG